MDVFTTALGGLNRAQDQFEKAGGKLASAAQLSSGSGPVDVADLSETAVSLLATKNDFTANVQVLKTADDIQRETINLLA